jgi:hypothetical protein
VKRARGTLFASCLFIAAAGAAAAPSNVQFSAQTVQSSPDKTTRHAQIYVGDNKVRLEYQQDDQKMIQIYDMENQRALLLTPQQRSYIERKLPRGGMANPMLPPSDTNPCAQMPDAECHKLGRETMYGRPVIKWEMVIKQDDQTLRSQYWIDAERNMPLRQVFPDGTVSEMRLLGKETLHGRKTERWEITTTRPDQESMTTTQWYDPELKIAIREELPGGYFRELRDIKLGPQPEDLFKVPEGYRQTTAPQQPGARPAPRQRSDPKGAPQSGQQYPRQSYPER